MVKQHGGFKCEECEESFKRVQHLKEHVAVVHRGEAPTYTEMCEHCGEAFTTQKMLKHHQTLHHSENRKIHNISRKASTGIFVCEECGEQFSSKTSLTTHLESKCKRNVCSICDKSFSSKSSWLRHKQEKHQEESKRNCEFCQKLFANAAELFKHFRENHPNSECPAEVYTDYFPCYICPNVLGSRESMYLHLKCTHKTILAGNELRKKCDELTKTKCPQCDQLFGSFMDCIDHYLDCHGVQVPDKLKKRNGKDRFLFCRQCSFEHKNITTYSHHRKAHNQ